MEEIWKDIKDYEGLYQVSNLGNVRSLKYNEKKILKPRYTPKGYIHYALFKNKIRKDYKGHRLVSQTFIPNPENKPQVNHINGIKDDNRIENLEWCTNLENQRHARKTKLYKKYYGKDNKNSKKINQYDLEGNFIKEWDSIVEASIIAQNSHICSCCKGKRNKAGGYIWRYTDEKRI